MSELEAVAERPELDDRGVARYLRDNPDFFHQHPQLLEVLRVPHQRAGAVSLVERQLSTLRDTNDKLKRQLHEMIGAARENDRIAASVHQFSLELMAADSLDDLLAASRDLLLEHFSADDVAVMLIDAEEGERSVDTPWRYVSHDHDDLQCFSDVLQNRKIRCGLASEMQKQVLFGERASDQASVAIVPLIAGRELGLLSLGSRSELTYTRDQGHLFLERVGQLVSSGVNRFLR
ncbi:MAG: DUF484 family protein [Granulosicoccaceae bacterium]